MPSGWVSSQPCSHVDVDDTPDENVTAPKTRILKLLLKLMLKLMRCSRVARSHHTPFWQPCAAAHTCSHALPIRPVLVFHSCMPLPQQVRTLNKCDESRTQEVEGGWAEN